MQRFLFAFTAALLVVSISYHASRAQLKGFSIGPYAELGWPVGDFSTTHNMGIGAGLDADIRLPAGLGITGSAGYMRFPGKDVDNGAGSTKMPAVAAFPIRVGLKYKFLKLLYIKLESGAANFTGDNSSGSAFILAPGIGLRFLGLDAELKYEAWMHDGTLGFFGLKAGYHF